MASKIGLSKGLAILATLTCFTVCGAQNPVIPGSDSIVGYVHSTDLQGLVQRSMQTVARHSPGAQSPVLAKLAGMAMGDPDLRVARPGQSAMWVFLRSPDGTIVRLLALPPGSAEPAYLNLKARQMQMEVRALPELVLIGPAGALPQAESLRPQIKSLLETTHPSDVSIYLQNDLWREQLTKMAGSGFAGVLGGALGRPPGAASQLSRPPLPSWKPDGSAPAGAGVSSFPAQVAGQILLQIRMLHVMVDVKEDAVRIAANLQAEEGSDLARFCTQSALPQADPATGASAATNPMSGFLPESGSLRLTAYLGEEGPAKLVTQAVKSVAEKVQMPAEEQARLISAAEKTLFYKGQCGFSVLRPGSYVALVTPVDPQSALDSLLYGLDTQLRQGLSVPPPQGASPGATPASVPLSPASGGTSALSPASPPPPTGGATSERGVVLNEGKGNADPEIHEGFAIHRFSTNSASAPSAPSKPLLVASFIGGYLVFSPEESEVKGSVDRLLMLNPSCPPLKAYSEFVAGGNLYADVGLNFAPGSPAGGAGAQLCAMGRTGESRAQFAILVPGEALAQVAALVQSAVPAGGTAGSGLPAP